MFLAFSTAHGIPRDLEINVSHKQLTVSQRNPVLEDAKFSTIFEGDVGAVVEVIYNALCMAGR